jgi:hypothetical protein
MTKYDGIEANLDNVEDLLRSLLDRASEGASASRVRRRCHCGCYAGTSLINNSRKRGIRFIGILPQAKSAMSLNKGHAPRR